MYNLLIPNMLLVCIKNERGLSCFPVVKVRAPNTFWSDMTPEKKKAFLKKRGKAISKALRKKTPEQLRERTRKASEKLAELYNDPVTGPEMREKQRRIFNKAVNRHRKKIVKDVPRINTYSGTITESQMAELNA